MLAEIKNARQIPGEAPRRWFTDGDFDLIVWLGRDGQVSGFQLCYDKQTQERALTWKRGRGFLHERIDDGESPGRVKMSPILVPDGEFRKETVLERFRRESGQIDPALRRLVLDTLSRYPVER
jgi:hypothetical protein